MDIISYLLARSYVKKTLAGVGAIKGKPCQIQNIEPITGGKRVTFLWVDNSNVEHTSTMDVMNGLRGEQGLQGIQGPQGPAGVGLPEGGTTGQTLTKKSATDYDYEWTSLGTASLKDATDVVRPNSHDLVESNAVANAINQALTSVYTPRGDLPCAELTSELLIEANVGNVYEMSDSGTTSALFIQGAGISISAGNNVGIIKASANTIMFNYMGNSFDLHDYQKKDLASAVEGATTVEGALGALSTNKQPKTLETPLTINGVSRTTVENALGELNKAVNQRYGKNFSGTHDRYVKIGSIPISDTTSKRCQIDLLIFNNQLYGKVHLSLESRNNALAINGSSDIDLSMTDTVKPRIVASKDETNGVFNLYVDSSYTYLGIILYQYFPVSTFEVANFSDSASVVGTKVFDSSTDLTKIAYVKPDVYSTTETKTNKVWIDGKPIYRKAFGYTSVVTTGNSAMIGTIDNMADIINIQGTFRNNNDNNCFPIGYTFSNNSGITAQNFPFVLHANGKMYANAYGFDIKNINVVVEYTKTT